MATFIQHENTNIVLNEWQQANAAIQIQNFLSDHGMTPNPNGVRTGNSVKNAKPRTKKQYAYVNDQFRCFAILREDFQTACFLTEDMCPEVPLPPKPSTICEYLLYKSEKSGTILHEYQTRRPAIVRNGNESTSMICTGQWKSPVCIYKFCAALGSVLYRYDEFRGSYTSKCYECIVAQSINTIPGTYASCRMHAGNPRLMDAGNPMASQLYKNEQVATFERVASHQVRGSEQLLPGDIRDLRQRLVGNDIQDYQMYVMVLLGLKLFLRCNELLALKIEDFKKEHSVVNQDEVRAVVVVVKGKSDRKKRVRNLPR
jgi:hypothetical protein